MENEVVSFSNQHGSFVMEQDFPEMSNHVTKNIAASVYDMLHILAAQTFSVDPGDYFIDFEPVVCQRGGGIGEMIEFKTRLLSQSDDIELREAMEMPITDLDYRHACVSVCFNSPEAFIIDEDAGKRTTTEIVFK